MWNKSRPDAEAVIRLTRAIREHSGLELAAIREAGEHGADAGWGGFTYTSDGAEFTRANKELVWELVSETAEEMGQSELELLASFTRADMADSADGLDCLLAWFALEECGRFWNDRRDSR